MSENANLNEKVEQLSDTMTKRDNAVSNNEPVQSETADFSVQTESQDVIHAAVPINNRFGVLSDETPAQLPAQNQLQRNIHNERKEQTKPSSSETTSSPHAPIATQATPSSPTDQQQRHQNPNVILLSVPTESF